MPGEACSSGTTSLSKMLASGSGDQAAAARVVTACPMAIGVLLKAVGCGWANRCLRCGDRRRVGLSELHVEPHLVIGYVAAGHRFLQTGRTQSIPGQPQSPEHQPEGRMS